MNSYLLSKFVSNTKFRSDLKSSLLRFQSLSIIYVNFVIALVVLGMEIVLKFSEKEYSPGMRLIISITIPLSLYLLRKGRRKLSAALILGSTSMINHYASVHLNLPLAALSAQAANPVFGFCLTDSKALRWMNIVCCIVQMGVHIMRLQDIFQITTTYDQYVQIYTHSFLSILIFVSLCLLFFIYKSIEIRLWEAAQGDMQKLEKLTKEVVQAAEAKNTFVSSISHEIRNPLNALNGSIQYLLTVTRDCENLKVLKNAQLSGKILLNLVNNVLDAAKLRSAQMEISCSEGSFESVVRDVICIHSETLKAKNINVVANLDKNLPQTLWFDQSRVLQIVMNLFSNAVKFTKSSGQITIHAKWCNQSNDDKELLLPIKNYLKDEPTETRASTDDDDSEDESMVAEEFMLTTDRIPKTRTLEEIPPPGLKKAILEDSHHLDTSLFLSRSTIENNEVRRSPSQLSKAKNLNGYLKVQVSDNGIGVSKDSINKLFTMFTQAHQSVESMSGGTGLGLWICKELCQKMQGDVKIYSKENQGTTFVFYIPINNQQIFQKISSKTMMNSSNNCLRALVVDDYSFNRDLHRLLLERENVQVVVASDGREALEKYKSQGDGYFNMVLMDVQMPEMDGFATAKMIRRWEEEKGQRKTDIYFISGEYYDEQALLSEFRTTGGDETDEVGIRCLKKPIDFEIIKKIVAEMRIPIL